MKTLAPKSSLRRNYSFTKSFLSELELNEFANDWARELAPSLAQYHAQKINGAELCTRLVLVVYKSLFASRWQNGQRQTQVEFAGGESFQALNTLGRYKIRSLPDAATEALLRWGKGEIELKMFHSLPAPTEVLELQSRGIRCVSVFLDASEMRAFRHEGRDFFSFLIHDLIHAQLMTRNSEDFEQQVKFAMWLKTNWTILTEGLSREANTELEYMASDMNSHIVHLTKTFKSWVERHKPELLLKSDWFNAFSNEGSVKINEEFLVHWQKLNLKGEGSHQVDQTHLAMLEFWKNLPLSNQL